MQTKAKLGRTIVVGDLHGCYEEALDLFELLEVESHDRVIFAGDLVDRGPYPRECVELAMQHEAVLGNHEAKHLRQRHRSLDSMLPDHARTLGELENVHLNYFASLPKFLRLPEFGAAVVHGGALPHRPLETQPDRILLHAQALQPMDDRTKWPSKAPAGWKFWTNFWRGPERLIFGHTVLDQPLVSEWAVGVDTGCVHGRSLTAVVLPDWEIVSVPAHECYAGKKGSGLARYPVMQGVHCFS